MEIFLPLLDISEKLKENLQKGTEFLFRCSMKNKENSTFSVSDREQVWSTYSWKAEYIFAPTYTITLKYGQRNIFPY